MNTTPNFPFQKTVIQPVTAYGHPITAAVFLKSSLHDGTVSQIVSACVFNPAKTAEVSGIGFYFERTFSGNPATFKGQGPSILYALSNLVFKGGDTPTGRADAKDAMLRNLKQSVPDAAIVNNPRFVESIPSFIDGRIITAAEREVYPLSIGGMRFHEPQAEWEKSDWIFNKVFNPTALCHIEDSPMTAAMKNTLAQLGRTFYNNVGPLYPEHPLVVMPSKPHPVP